MDQALPPVCLGETTQENWESRRAELVSLFAQNVFGNTPRGGYSVSSEVISSSSACEGTATREVRRVSIQTARGTACFRLSVTIPNRNRPVPAVLMISNHDAPGSVESRPDMGAVAEKLRAFPADFLARVQRMTESAASRPAAPESRFLDIERDEVNEYWPVAKIVASGRAAAAFYASEVQPDDASQFPSGISALFERGKEGTAWGTLGVWAFAASRSIDILTADSRIDASSLSVAGHSRGGKTALWCAAQDSRVNAVFANNSGCTGAALSRGKQGENVAFIQTMFPHWFCPNYAQYAWREAEMPFDQHMLIAAVAPRLCYAASGPLDTWSDPDAEWRGVQNAWPAWGLFGAPPLPAHPPKAGHAYAEGPLGYHRREGGHDLTAWDWDRFLDFLNLHRV